MSGCMSEEGATGSAGNMCVDVTVPDILKGPSNKRRNCCVIRILTPRLRITHTIFFIIDTREMISNNISGVIIMMRVSAVTNGLH